MKNKLKEWFIFSNHKKKKMKKYAEKNAKYESESGEVLLPKLLTSLETLNLILDEKKSIARYGDGEFRIIFGKGIGFQKKSKNLD